MDEREFARFLADTLEMDEEIYDVSTFEEVGLLTMDAGIVVRMEDGSEFQITIVRGR